MHDNGNIKCDSTMSWNLNLWLHIYLYMHAKHIKKNVTSIWKITSSGPFQYEDHLSRYIDPHYKDKTVIIIMGIPIPDRQHLHIETEPCRRSFRLTWMNSSVTRYCTLHYVRGCHRKIGPPGFVDDNDEFHFVTGLPSQDCIKHRHRFRYCLILEGNKK